MKKQHIIKTCGSCAKLGDEVVEDWMIPREEHYHECPYAAAFKGLAEEQDDACIWYEHYKN